MKPITFALCLTFAGACGAPGSDATKASVDELRAVLPTRATLTIAPVANAAAATPQTTPSACAALAPSTYGTLTHTIASNVDGVIGGVTGMVEQIAATPPAATAPGHAAWGPIASSSGAVVYRLDAAAASPSEIHFELAGKPAAADDSAWQTVFGGASVVGDATHHEGQVAVDFGVMHALDATVDPLAGNVAAHFAVAGAARDVNAAFAGISGKSAPQPDDAAYAFVGAAGGGAGLAFSTRVDFDGDGVLDELAHIDSRWSPSGSGAAQITVTGGKVGAASAFECWDATLARVYYKDSVGTVAGDASCCPQ